MASVRRTDGSIQGLAARTCGDPVQRRALSLGGLARFILKWVPKVAFFTMARRSDKDALSAKLRRAASTNSNSVHIVPSKDGWSVKREGAVRSTAVRATKGEALKAARELKSAERIIIHNQDGTIAKNVSRKK